MKQNCNVPAFLSKLWTLVEDADTNEFICWSQEGTSFLVLDEQRFAKEILPKFFKHNNMASFIRQLNMYGFRKVMHIDAGVVKQERDGPVEFQHPHFKHGQDKLLEHIKRKVSTARPDDGKIRQDDLTKILAGVQNVHSKQESIDTRLVTLKRENETLWREISDLRQKHVHQQQLIKKLIQFIVTLVQNNHILNLKRKRPILMKSSGKKTKYIHQLYEDKVCVDQLPVNGLNPVKNSDVSDDVIICDLSESDAEVTETSSRSCDQGDAGIVEVDLDGCTVLPAEMEVSTSCTDDTRPTDAHRLHVSDGSGADGSIASSSGATSSGSGASGSGTSSSGALQLNKTSSLSLEDPLKMMDSILKENGAISQNINLLGKVELMDYLDSIDCSLEDFQAMVYGKQFGIDCDALEESISPKDHDFHLNREKTDDDNTDKQLIQYTTCPLMAFLDGCTLTPDLDPGSGGTELCSPLEEAGPALELLDLEPKQTHSSLIRLEPLTEAEASEETLFYLCELNPDESESNESESNPQ